jgi:hypothetical protein
MVQAALRCVGVGVAAAILSLAPDAGAEESQDESRSDHRMHWDYPRFRPAEYVITGIVTGAGFWIERGTRGNPDNSIHSGILLDEPTRDLLVLPDRPSKDVAARVSDVLWHTTQYYPVADSLVTPLLTDDFNVDVAMQMTLINWQVQGVSFFLTRATHRLVGRTRPVIVGCAEDPASDTDCVAEFRGIDSALNGSFLSGHTSMAFAGASSACSHHIALPMYGGNAADAVVCATLLTSATTVGVLRIVADKHWWSDVVAGASLGMATGFGLPFLLHYTGGPVGVETEVLGKQYVLPIANSEMVGVGTFSVW